MDTKQIEAVISSLLNSGTPPTPESVRDAVVQIADALLAPAASEAADLPVGFLADVSREVEERIAQRPEWQRRALEERLRRVEEQVKASEPKAPSSRLRGGR